MRYLRCKHSRHPAHEAAEYLSLCPAAAYNLAYTGGQLYYSSASVLSSGNVTRYLLGDLTVQARPHDPCSGGLVRGMSASRRLSESTQQLSGSVWEGRSLATGFFGGLGGTGGVACPDRPLIGLEPHWLAGRSGAGLGNRGPEAALFSGAKLGSDGAPAHGKLSNGHSSGTVERRIVQRKAQ